MSLTFLGSVPWYMILGMTQLTISHKKLFSFFIYLLIFYFALCQLLPFMMVLICGEMK